MCSGVLGELGVEHTEPGFLQDEVSPASCFALWFDDKLKGHTVGTGEGTSTSSCPKGALDGQGPGSGLRRKHLPLCGVALLQSSSVGNQPYFKASFQRKSLLAALRPWQVSADCSSAGICCGCHCPLPPSPCCVSAAQIRLAVQQPGPARAALAFPLQTGS